MDKNEIEKFSEFEDFLNIIVGVLAFSFGLQCLSFDHIEPYYHSFSKQSIYSCISFAFINLLLIVRVRKVGKIINNMKKEKPAYLDSLLFALKNPAYIAGYLFLALVTFGKLK